MKKTFLLTVCTLLTIMMQAQNLIGKSFITLVENVRVYPADTPDNDGKHFYYVHANTAFTVTNIDSNHNLVITFWPYKKPGSANNLKLRLPLKLETGTKNFYSSLNQQPGSARHGAFGIAETGQDYPVFGETADTPYNPEIDTSGYIGSWVGSRSMVIPLPAFNQQTVPFYGRHDNFTWGVLTLPVKMRFGNKGDRYFNFEEKINLGFTAGWQHQFQSKTQQSINVLVGFGVASVKTDSVSLNKGFYDSQHSSETAFSFNTGVLYQYDVFQLGVFWGKDYLGSTLGRQWKYQGKSWIGLAIGISLFGKQTSTSTIGNN